MRTKYDLRDLRLARGRPGKPYTLREVGVMTRLGVSQISRAERGLRRFSRQALFGLATFYGMSLPALEAAAAETARKAAVHGIRLGG